MKGSSDGIKILRLAVLFLRHLYGILPLQKPNHGTAVGMYAVGALRFSLSGIVLIFNTLGKEQTFSMRSINLPVYFPGRLMIAFTLFFI